MLKHLGGAGVVADATLTPAPARWLQSIQKSTSC
ncbi:hypothetical protein SACE_5086 [Saccharopolyspora erythraea NRRL 2338]|uniref:Uncharacterized protein n=1 Tax=Saccharopolyspora erythraea (strain ATCC 11635 / DSM 40517 / JCM 4748 / NBRC 13426 / NCIMB 8594 / NRRL 2338) TaxID=405948 RepID=A4FJW8_SACEN|nr:hypothetical protein SACE_5086 [Saccharopolyspora erythraea NRRL 2338]